jgi:hypothetical protein
MTILRKALLGGAALAVMTTGAQADELTALKAQLEALQNRVDTMEAAPANLEGKSLLTFERGQGGNTWDVVSSRDAASTNKDSGFTVAVTPTADMPAPVAEVTVYGYVGAHLHYAFDGRARRRQLVLRVHPGKHGGDHISLTAQQSRFGIKSKIDTAIGQIRTQIEADFTPGGGNAGSLPIRLRHAVGHWDMTPNWTFTAGQYWYTAALLPIGVSTVDFNGALLTYSRTAQFRLSYADGPLSWAVAIENPTLRFRPPTCRTLLRTCSTTLLAVTPSSSPVKLLTGTRRPPTGARPFTTTNSAGPSRQVQTSTWLTLQP